MSHHGRRRDLARGTHMLVVPTTADDADVIGFRPVESHLPAVHRLPGETIAQLIRRALAMATGTGPFLAYFTTKVPPHDQP